MFRIEFLKLKEHPQLGDIELYFSEAGELQKEEKPYTSVIIGPNGTGKSFILRTVAEIFRQFKTYSQTGKKEFKLPFDIHFRYWVNQNIYEIAARRVKTTSSIGRRKDYLFLKNRPLNKDFTEDNLFETEKRYRIKVHDIEFPDRLLVNSIVPTDRFVFFKSKPEDFYQYLGARSTRSTASTKSSVKKIIKHIFNATIESKEFIGNLKELLTFLEFSECFKVQYKTKINNLFFSSKLTKENFKIYYEKWWDKNFEYTKRKKENPIWSIPYYNENFKNNIKLTDSLVKFLNNIALDENKFIAKPKTSSKLVVIDLLNENISEEDLTMISHLENLDIINLEGIQIQKTDKSLSTEDISSGEYHLLISFIGMFANITNKSLILIDEPEISLHPNWQMRYISFLKKVFTKFSSCHFILTTHSHFLVSDLEGESSAVIALRRNPETSELSADLLKGQNTYGWSVEEVLYSVFKVRSVRNYFLEQDLTNLLGLIGQNSKDKNEISKLIHRIDEMPISDNDPLKDIIVEAKNFLQSID